jgi:hypothetical protein
MEKLAGLDSDLQTTHLVVVLPLHSQVLLHSLQYSNVGPNRYRRLLGKGLCTASLISDWVGE